MMRTTIKTEVIEGIVLERTPYKENDMILHVYSKEYGKISLLARGIKKITSKNARACQEMMVSEFTVSIKKGLSSLMKATPLYYLRHIGENLESEIVGQYILEYYYRYIEDNQPVLEDYDMLKQSLQALDVGYPPLYVYLLFLVFVLNHNGVSLEVDGCVKCGSSQVVTISLMDGGYLCSHHVGHQHIYQVEVLKAFRHIHKIPIEHIDRLHMDEDVVKELVKVMTLFVDEYTGISLRTKKFIEQIV